MDETKKYSVTEIILDGKIPLTVEVQNDTEPNTERMKAYLNAFEKESV